MQKFQTPDIYVANLNQNHTIIKIYQNTKYNYKHTLKYCVHVQTIPRVISRVLSVPESL